MGVSVEAVGQLDAGKVVALLRQDGRHARVRAVHVQPAPQAPHCETRSLREPPKTPSRLWGQLSQLLATCPR